MQAGRLLCFLVVACPLALAAGCDRSLLHSLPDPLPANDQGSTCAGSRAPSDLVAVAHEDRVALSWTDNASGALKFVIERRTDGGFEDLTAPLAVTSHDDTVSLAKDTVYGYRVRGEGDGCATAASEAVDVLTLPHAPTGVEASGGDDRVTLTWSDPNERESGYRVDLVEAAGDTPLATLPADSTTWVDEGLGPDTVRRYRVIAVNASGEAGTVVEGGSRPRAPSDLIATATEPNRVALSWTDPNANESGYRVYRDDGAGETLLAELPADATSYEDESATDSTPYTYAVTATNASGESARATATATTPCAAGSTPSDLLVLASLSEDWSAPHVEASWQAADAHAFAWQLERKAPDDASFVEVANSAVGDNWLVDGEEPAPDTRYAYRVRGQKRACAVVSDEVEVVTPIPPLLSDAITVTSLSDAALQIEWSDTFEHETGFGVYLFGSGETAAARHEGSPPAGQTTLVAEGLEPGRRYAAVVLPEVPGSETIATLGLPAEEVYARIAAEGQTLPSAPSAGDVKLTVRSASSIELEVLSLPFGADAIAVYRVGGALVGTLAAPGSVFDEGLVAGTEYEYDFFGVNDAGRSAPHRELGVTFSPPELSWTGFWPLLPASQDGGTCSLLSEGNHVQDPDLYWEPEQSADATVVTDPLGLLSAEVTGGGVSITVPEAERYFRRPFTVRWDVSDPGGSASLARAIVLDVTDGDPGTPAPAPYGFGPGQQVSDAPYGGPFICDGASCFGPRAAVSAGDAHSCLIDLDQQVWCWGDDERGALGNGSGGSTNLPTPVCADEACATTFTGARALATGYGFSCALVDEALWCWGDPAIGVTGSDPAKSNRIHPEAPVVTSGVQSVAAGSDFVCFTAEVSGRGEVHCFGQNHSLQLGGDVGAVADTPERVCPATGSCNDVSYAAVSAGDAHACAVTAGGEVHCWGKNTSGQLGRVGASDPSLPVAVECGALSSDPTHCDDDGNLTGVAQVTTGRDHTCALLDDGRVTCWGSNAGSRLALSTALASSPAPTLPCADETCDEALDDVIALAAGGSTCAIKSDLSLWCWGAPFANRPRQLCDGGFGAGGCTEDDPPVRAVAVEAGMQHLCLVEESGRARCAGFGGRGERGDGTNAGIPSDTRVSRVCRSGAGNGCERFDTAAVMACGTLTAREVTE